MAVKLDDMLARMPPDRRAKVEARAVVLIGRERSAMSEPDVVAQIDACEIVGGVGDIIMPRWLVLHARDEIAALRTLLIRSRSVLRTCAYDRPSDLDQMRSDVIWRLIQEIDSALKEKP